MEQAVSIYAQKVATRLRAQNSVTKHVSVWAATGWADTGTPSHSAHVAVPLPTPTDDPITLTKAVRAILPHLFPGHSPGVRYARLGVVLTDLRPPQAAQVLDLFAPAFAGREIGAAIDEVYRKLGGPSIGVGLGGMKTPPGWEMKRAMLSKRATTNWDELVTVQA